MKWQAGMSRALSSFLKPLFIWSRRLYTPLSFLVLTYFACTEWPSISPVFERLEVGIVGLIVLCVASGHAFIALSTQKLLSAQNISVPFPVVYFIHVNRLPARYLPGGIWQTVARASDFFVHGISKAGIAKTIGLEIGVALGLALLMGATALILSGGVLPVTLLVPVALAGLIGLVGQLILLFRRHISLTQHVLTAYAKGVFAFALVWLLYGFAFALYVKQLLPGALALENVGIYLLSWAVGFFAFFAPQGIGVFELVSSYLMKGEMVASFVMALLGFRLLALMSDLLVWAICRIFLRSPEKYGLKEWS